MRRGQAAQFGEIRDGGVSSNEYFYPIAKSNARINSKSRCSISNYDEKNLLFRAGEQLGKGVAKAFNFVSEFLKKDKRIDMEVRDLFHLYGKNFECLKNLDRVKLNNLLIQELRERADCDSFDEETLSNAVVSKVFSYNQVLNVQKLTLRKKADCVAEKFKDEMRGQKIISYLLDVGILDISSINRKFLSFVISLAQALNGRNFAPTDEDLVEWKNFHAAHQKVQIEFNTCYNNQLPAEDEFLTDAEINRRFQFLEQKATTLRQYLEQTFDAEYHQKKTFSECADIEHDELQELYPLSSMFFVLWRYRTFVNANNKKFKDNMNKGNSTVYLNVPEIGRIEPLETKDVLARIHNGINSAKKETDMLIPWMYWDNIRENFLEEFRSAINRNVTIKIHYGYQKSNYDDTNTDSDLAAEMLINELGYR